MDFDLDVSICIDLRERERAIESRVVGPFEYILIEFSLAHWVGCLVGWCCAATAAPRHVLHGCHSTRPERAIREKCAGRALEGRARAQLPMKIHIYRQCVND